MRDTTSELCGKCGRSSRKILASTILWDMFLNQTVWSSVRKLWLAKRAITIYLYSQIFIYILSLSFNSSIISSFLMWSLSMWRFVVIKYYLSFRQTSFVNFLAFRLKTLIRIFPSPCLLSCFVTSLVKCRALFGKNSKVELVLLLCERRRMLYTACSRTIQVNPQWMLYNALVKA